jgi:thioredoxin reductase/polyferredoxin
VLPATIRAILDSPNATGAARRPVLDAHFESVSVPGLFVVGDLAGAPVVKLAMEQGHDVAEYIASLPDAAANADAEFDVLVVGAGAAGLNAALAAQQRGLRVAVLEKSNRLAATIDDFPEGKWIYAEPESRPVKGRLWLDNKGATKEDLLARWRQDVREGRLDVRTGEAVTAIERQANRHLVVRTASGARHTARRVILATGQRGNPRWLGVAGEDRENVHHRLYSPGHYRDEDILVVGGGNSAIEAALALSQPGNNNHVTVSYRGSAGFARVFKDNRRKLNEAVAAGRIRVEAGSRVTAFSDSTYSIQTADGAEHKRPYHRAFVLAGAETPVAFLKSLGLRLENEWDLRRWLWLAVSFAIAYTIYGAKQSPGHEFWPYKGWGYQFFSFGDRPMSFWYTVAYTLVMTVFGIQAMKRWGFDRKDRFQVWRYASLIGFQWLFFFLIPEFLFRYALQYQWLAGHNPGDAWRSYGLVYAWPLFFHTFIGSPHRFWIIWGVLLSFVILPVLALYHGKRYCSWICGCGGLAETLGDRWRHLAPKGRTSIRWEWMNGAVLAVASALTIVILASDAVAVLRPAAAHGSNWYGLIANTWLVGIIPVALYPFFGGKIWCRYWCPLAKMMQIFSSVFTRFRASRFAIHANDKCIACGECSRNCQVGIDVMNFALTQRTLDNSNSSCIGCGICVTVCPMDVLSFTRPQPEKLVQIETVKALH